MRPDMHARSIEIAEPGLSFFRFTVDEIFRRSQEFFIYCFHTFPGERPGIFNHLFTDSSKLRIDSCIIFSGCFAFQHATRPEFLLEAWILWIIRILWFFFSVEMIKIAEEFIEAMNSR